MCSARRYNLNYAKRLRDKRSRAGKESQRVQSLKRQAMADQGWDNFEDIIERHKHDRKGKHYATWQRDGLRFEISHAAQGRSDQYDVTEIRDSKWGGEPIVTHHVNLSLPNALKRFVYGK